MESTAALIVFAVLLGLSAFFSGSETALCSITRVKALELAGRGASGKMLRLWIENPERYLTTILIGNNVVNVASASLATVLVAEAIGGTAGRAVAIATGAMTFLILVFGEITPKHFSKRHSERIALLVIRPLTYLSVLLHPFVVVLSWISSCIMFLMGGGVKPTRRFTADALRAAITLGSADGAIETQERDMLAGVLSLGQTRVMEVMVPRVDMATVPVGANRKEVLERILLTGHSRYPVYDARDDGVPGILYAKDLFRVWHELEEAFSATGLARPPKFVPETVTAREALAELRGANVHMALVVDEHGSLVGLVTLEDLLEEVVGEIEDEHEARRRRYVLLDNGTLRVDARLELKEAATLFGIEFPECPSNTLAGFVLERFGEIPSPGRSFVHEGHELRVARSTARAILLLDVRKVGVAGADTPAVPAERGRTVCSANRVTEQGGHSAPRGKWRSPERTAPKEAGS